MVVYHVASQIHGIQFVLNIANLNGVAYAFPGLFCPDSATSGDTGSAAIHCVKKMANADIIVLYPKGRCTHVQELQMTTVQSPNVHVFAGS